MNALQPFESTIEQKTETMTPSHKTITAAAMRTNRITSLLKSHREVSRVLLKKPLKGSNRFSQTCQTRLCCYIFAFTLKSTRYGYQIEHFARPRHRRNPRPQGDLG